jgi:hypothetical protein
MRACLVDQSVKRHYASCLLSTVFCDLALLLGLADARRYDRSQLQALVEVLRLDLVGIRRRHSFASLTKVLMLLYIYPRALNSGHSTASGRRF